MASGYLHELFESIPGNETNSPTASTKIIYHPIQSAKVALNPKHMDRDDELRNQDQPLSVLTQAYDPSWEYAARAYPDLLAFRLKAMLGSPTTTAGDGIITDPDAGTIPTGATRHVWTAPFGPSGVSPQTTQQQFAYKDQTTFFKAKGCATSSLEIESPEEGGVGIKASGEAAYLERVADPALTPAYEALTVRPFTRSGLTLPTWLTGTGTHEDFSISVENPIEMVRSLGIPSKYPDVVEKGEGLITVTGSLAKRQLDPDDYNALRDATAFAAKAKWLSDSIITGAYKYTLWIEMASCQYVEGEIDELSNKRRHGGNFNFKATFGGSTASCTVTLINNTASYA